MDTEKENGGFLPDIQLLAYFIPIMGVGKRGAYLLAHGDLLPR